MPKQTIKLLDYKQEKASNSIVPNPAIIASSGWSDLHLEFHQQPEFETAEHQHTMHVIACGVGDPVIDANLVRNLKIVELAKIAQISPYHFIRLFNCC